MARTVSMWRKLVTIEWEQSVRLEQADVDRLEQDNPLRRLLQAALNTGDTVDIELTPELVNAMYADDWGWKHREVIEDRIEQADISAD